jgi:hypothetical protein
LAERLIASCVFQTLTVEVFMAAPATARSDTGQPIIEQQQKVSEALTKGVALFTTLLGVLAARDGGVGRLLANARSGVVLAVVSVVFSVLMAFFAWIYVSSSKNPRTSYWILMMMASVVLLIFAFLFAVFASNTANDELEQPTLTVKHGPDGLEFTARIELLKADGSMRTTVYGYPAEGGGRELLFNSTSGPNADGQASLTGSVQSPLSDYEVVEVRAHRGDRDPGCERLIGPQTPGTGSAACASIWIEPLRGT